VRSLIAPVRPKLGGNLARNLDKLIFYVPRVKIPQTDGCHLYFLRSDFWRVDNLNEDVGERQPGPPVPALGQFVPKQIRNKVKPSIRKKWIDGAR